MMMEKDRGRGSARGTVIGTETGGGRGLGSAQGRGTGRETVPEIEIGTGGSPSQTHASKKPGVHFSLVLFCLVLCNVRVTVGESNQIDRLLSVLVVSVLSEMMGMK